MTTLTTLSWAHETGGHRQENQYQTETDTLHDFREVQPKLADDFETWYAQKNPATKCNEGFWRKAYPPDEPDQSWMYAILGPTEPNPKSSDVDYPDQAQLAGEPAYVADDTPTSWMDWSQYRDQGSDFARKKVRTRKWKLSTPPALCKVHEKHLQKLEDRKPARKTVRHSWKISWDDETSMWPETFSEDSLSSSKDHSDCSPENSKLKTTFLDTSWSERQLWEQFPELKKHKAYQPSLLRWCCTVTEN